MENTNLGENKMGIMPVNKLLLSMSLPMIFSMIIQALYNVVDSIFVSQISENALTAVSLAFPFQNLMIAVASGTSVGINAVLSRCLGAKEFAKCIALPQGEFSAFLKARPSERTEIMSLITHPHDLACIPFSKQHLSFPAKARILLILQH